jgi:hypothetical protein
MPDSLLPEPPLDWSDVSYPETEDFRWDACSAARGSAAAEEYIPLEMRGTTPQKTYNLHLKKPGPRQLEIWKTQTIHKNTVASKLREVGMSALAAKLENCHSYYTFVVCSECGATRKFPNRCDLFCCPECAHHLQRHRELQVRWWTWMIDQPKHVVLTIKNIWDLTPGHVDELRKMFTQLRRRKFAKNWIGGFYRIECTNDGHGWHLHIHALVEAAWIDVNTLKEQWLSVTRGFGYIVKVRDCRQHDYLHEVTKYVAKGNQLAAWQPAELATFIRAFTGKRTFGVFGSLYSARTKFAEFIASLKEAKPKCDCGSCTVKYYDEAQFLALSFSPKVETKPRPPPARDIQVDNNLAPAIYHN